MPDLSFIHPVESKAEIGGEAAEVNKTTLNCSALHDPCGTIIS